MEHFKIMVTGLNEGLLWRMIDETEVDLQHDAYKVLNNELDLPKWKQDYVALYRQWLDMDDQSIYDINHPVNFTMISVLERINKVNNNFKLYLWFDVERDKYPEFIWKTCPISNEPLIRLPDFYHVNNRAMSQVLPLIFPDVE